MNINPAYRPEELQFTVNNVGVEALITVGGDNSNYMEVLNNVCPNLATSTPGQLQSDNLPTLKHVITIGSNEKGCHYFDDVYNMTATEYKTRTANVRYNEATNIQFTSGTTGKPKGATLSHLNLLNNAKLVGDLTHVTQNDRICVPVPMYHCFGMVLGELLAMIKGASIVFPSFGF